MCVLIMETDGASLSMGVKSLGNSTSRIPYVADGITAILRAVVLVHDVVVCIARMAIVLNKK